MSDCPVSVFVTEEAVQAVIHVSDPACSGASNEPGSFWYSQAEASLSALHAVQQSATGGLIYAQPTEAEAERTIGVLLTGVSPGGTGKVAQSGVIDISGLGLVPGRVWLGEDGRLIQTPPDGEVSLVLGVATSETQMIVSIFESIFL